jgi:hypothetical protein
VDSGLFQRCIDLDQYQGADRCAALAAEFPKNVFESHCAFFLTASDGPSFFAAKQNRN